MQIRELSLRNFRNIKNQVIDLSPRITVFIGKNAQGKTSILEAVYLLSHTKSFREAKIREIICWEDGTAEVEVKATLIDSDGFDKSAGYTISNSGRTFYLNNSKIQKATDFYGVVKIVEFTPEDLQLIKGEPVGRRQFLDKTITLFDNSYLITLMAYQRALKQRNAVLKRDGKSPDCAEKLSPWTSLLIAHGAVLAAERQRLVRELSELVGDFYRQISGKKSGEDSVSLSYQSEFLNSDYDHLSRRFSEDFVKDRALKRTSFGPHRDDLLVQHQEQFGEKSARVSASQGQARSLALALKLAACAVIKQKTGESPVLLLDDVESELDTERVERLYEILKEHRDSQILLTGVDHARAREWFGEDISIHNIFNGKIASRNPQ